MSLHKSAARSFLRGQVNHDIMLKQKIEKKNRRLFPLGHCIFGYGLYVMLALSLFGTCILSFSHLGEVETWRCL